MHLNSVLNSSVGEATAAIRRRIERISPLADTAKTVCDAVQTQNESVETNEWNVGVLSDRRAIVTWAAVGYALGSVCWGHVFAQWRGESLSPDEHPGTRATAERFGLKLGIGTLLLDVSMAAIPVFLARTLQSSPQAAGVAGLAAAAGHLWPVYFGFHGGHLASSLVGSLLGWGHAGEATTLLAFCLSSMVVGKSIQKQGYLDELDITAFAFTSAFAGLFVWFHSYDREELVYFLVGLGIIAGFRFIQNVQESQTPGGA
ncbi:MAG TPA: glycerol-3-phosphate acyltransferase [Halococcus sp.]|nr:glycerol-3-phosphate acyltransferase [Halococcus sp.]